MKVLAFDSSSRALSVALLENKELIAQTTINIKKNHSVTLMTTIDFLMASVDWVPTDLECVVVAKGPGSYTGLRVAVATAKMLAYSLKIDLKGVSSLYALAAPVKEKGLIVPLMDARRQNVYVGFYEDGKSIRESEHLPLEKVLQFASSYTQVTFVGESAVFTESIKEVLPQAQIMTTLPSAYEIGVLGQMLPSESVSIFSPDYLKRVEAEENWLKDHDEVPQDSYDKRI